MRCLVPRPLACARRLSPDAATWVPLSGGRCKFRLVDASAASPSSPPSTTTSSSPASSAVPSSSSLTGPEDRSAGASSSSSSSASASASPATATTQDEYYARVDALTASLRTRFADVELVVEELGIEGGSDPLADANQFASADVFHLHAHIDPALRGHLAATAAERNNDDDDTERGGGRKAAAGTAAATTATPTAITEIPGAYVLEVAPDGEGSDWFIRAADHAGIFYGVQTVLQIFAACGRFSSTWYSNLNGADNGGKEDDRHSNIRNNNDNNNNESVTVARCPAGLEICDAPCVGVRGFMLDVSRTRVPKLNELFALVDMLAHLKYNHLQLYTEHTFQYEEHETVWRGCSPITPADVHALDAYCFARHVELVPNQNSLGHMHRWLKHDAYRPMAELPGGMEHPFVAPGVCEPFGMCASDPVCVPFVQGLHTELARHFRSRRFNVNLDEPMDLGMGRSKAACAAAGFRGEGQ